MKNAVATLSLLALAGSVLAAPARYEERDVKVVYETQVYTVVVTPGVAQPTPAPQAQGYHRHSKKPADQPKPTSTAVYQPPPPPASSKVAPPAQTSAAAQPPSTGTGYMSVVNEWRQKLGLTPLTQDATLEKNAVKTCVDGNGEMKHELNPGSMGQVLAPGSLTKDFQHVFVGGWLCEKSNLPGLDGICGTESKGWAYGGQTGHADILTSKSYSKIGCGESNGIVGCDLA